MQPPSPPETGEHTAEKPGGLGQRLQAGDLLIDIGRREVRRGKRTIRLPNLSFELLLALAEAAPNLLTVDELIDRVWPGRVVSPETVTQRIKLLRRALGDDAQNPTYIAGLRGQGYRLLVGVCIADSVTDNQSLRVVLTQQRPVQGTLIGIGLLVVAITIWGLYELIGPAPAEPVRTDLPAVNTVAVLPFLSVGADENDRYISQGLGDELRDQLGRVAGLQVAARSSSIVVQNQAADAQTMAQRLGVRWLIESTLNKQGDRVRISVRIIDGESGFQTWSGGYDHLVSDLLGAQQDIATEVVAQILPAARNQISATNLSPRTVSAHTLMLLARHMEQQVRDNPLVDERLLARAIKLYREATETEPDNALAHSRLASVLLYAGDEEGAQIHIDRALQLNPDLADAYYSLGLVQWQNRRPEARQTFRKAVDLNPNHADALSTYALSLWHNHIVNQTEEYMLKALALDPLTLERYADLGNFYGMTGQRDKGLEIAGKVEELFPNVAGYRVLGRIYQVVGDLDQAIRWIRTARSLRPDLNDLDWHLAELYARIGEHEQAAALDPDGVARLFYGRNYEELIDRGEELLIENPQDVKLYYMLAFAYSTQGFNQEAARLLELVGLPDAAFGDAGRANESEALATYIGALMQSGQVERALELARLDLPAKQRAIDTGGHRGWWMNLYIACVYAYLGEETLMFTHLENVPDSPGLVWYPTLRDQQCFQPYTDNSRYLSVVKTIDLRMAEQRSRVAILDGAG